MTPSNKLKPFYRTVAGSVACIFLWQQISWAGDLLDSSINTLNTDQSQTFAPAYLQNQQALHEDMVSQDQAIEDTINSQNLATPTTATATETPQIDLQEKSSSSLGSAPVVQETSSTAASSTILEEGGDAFGADDGILSITTVEGDVIYYSGGAIERIEKEDGTVLRNIGFDENNNLLGADIAYADGTVQVIEGGKVTTITRPDLSVITYNDDETVKSVLYPDGITINYSYVTDAEGRIITVLYDSESGKTAYYDSDDKLKKVESGINGQVIEYEGGIISKITGNSGSYFFKKTVTGDLIEVRVSRFVDGNGFIFEIDENGAINSLTSPSGMKLTYTEDGRPASIQGDGLSITFDDKARVSEAVIEAVRFICGYEEDAAGSIVATIITDQAGAKARYDSGGALISVEKDGYMVTKTHLETLRLNLETLRQGSEFATAARIAAGAGLDNAKASLDKAIEIRDSTLRKYNDAKKESYTRGSWAWHFLQGRLLVYCISLAIQGSQITKAKSAYFISYRNYNAAMAKEASAVNKVTTATDKLDKAEGIFAIFTPDIKAYDYTDGLLAIDTKSAKDGIQFLKVTYDQNHAVKEVLKTDGEVVNYKDGLLDSVLSGSGITSYGYTLSKLGNIDAMAIDRDGIKRIYDKYGNIKSLSLNDATKIVYENGRVKEIEKSDGTKIKNMTFRDSGELDSALVSYPDGSVAVYDDAKLLQLISAAGDITDYADGKIRKVTLEDGAVYDWSYDGSYIIILDNSHQERRKYLEGRLIELEELTGARLTTKYSYDSASNLVKSEICKGGDVLYTYTYTYEGGLTLIHDEDGNIQAYTKDKKLSYIIDAKGRKYSYTYVGKNEGYIEVYFPSGVKAKYDAGGAIIDITEYDGAVIKDIVLAADNTPEDFTYSKDGVTYKVDDGVIAEVMGKEGTNTLYYDNGFIQSITSTLGELTEYRYYVEDSASLTSASTLLTGTTNNLSLYEQNSVMRLALSDTSFKFGTGIDGAKRVTSDETLAAGTYNFTSLTIDEGKALKIAPGAVINILGTAAISGAIFCGGTFNMNAYEVNIASGASITGAVNIKCDTINNAGVITGNACLTGTRSSGNDTVRDDNFSTALSNEYWGDSDSVYITFPECDISAAKYQIGVQGFGLTSYAAVYICANGSWINLLSYSSPGWGAINSGAVNNTAGWSNVTGMMMQGQSLNGDCVSSAYSLYEMQAIIGTPTIEYASGNPGLVNTSASRPIATEKQVTNPGSGSFESSVMELNALTLGSLSWSQETPDGTAVTFRTRTGDTATPDATWTDWSAPLTDPDGSTMLSPGKKYMQYKVTLSTTDPSKTPVLHLGVSDPIVFGYDRAPTDSRELLNIDHVKVSKDGITNIYDRDSWQSIIADPVFDADLIDSVIGEIPRYVLNDTQKEVYLRDSVIISELTAITAVDGTVTEYCQGQISKITRPDGTVITDIDFDADNNARDCTYYKNGNAYEVKGGVIDAVITAAGERIQYYSYGLIESRVAGSSTVEYTYGSHASEAYSTNAAFQGGVSNSASLFQQGGTSYLALSDTSFKFGTGIDGAKHVTSDETLAAGTYSFTSLTIDEGKTLKIAPGAVINILGTAAISGAIFCDGTFNMNAYDLSVASGASITGAVNIKCNTINNAGVITGNACMTGLLNGSGVVCDDNFSSAIQGSAGASATTTVTFPSCDVASARYRVSLGCYGVSAYASVLLCVNGSWVPLASYNVSSSTDSGVVNKTTGWSNVTGMMMSGQSRSGDCVSSSYALYEMQVIIGTPTIEYASGNPGTVNTSASRPTTTEKQVTNPGSGSFESSVMELNALTLGSLSWSQETPDGTAVTFRTRTGDTATPDAAWTDWSAPLTDPDGSAMLSPGKKYMQYKVTLSTTDPSKTPRIILDATRDISISYTKISDNPLDPYVKVKTSSSTKTYNRNGVNITDPTDTINVDSLKFDSAYLDSLKNDIPIHKLSDAQKVITIYDEGNDIPVEIVTAGQSITYFDQGFATKVVDKNGTTQVLYTYDENKNVIKAEFADARAKLEENYQKALSEIVTQKEAALAKLAKAESDSRADITAKSADIQQQINSERQRLTTERTKYDPNVYDLSEFGRAFAEIDSYEARLHQQTQGAYADLDNQVAGAKARIEQDSQTAMQNLINNDYNKILADIVQKESSPLIYQYYRKVLGRDPGDDDLLYWTNIAKTELRPITATELTQYLENLPGYSDRSTRKQNIIANITSFFTQYFSASETKKRDTLLLLGFTSEEASNIIQSNLTQADVDAILSWLNGQSLHFGDSAFETVISMLESSGINKSFEDIGKDAIKIDILTGVITKDTKGDLLISMYAMRKAAEANSLTLYSQKISYDDLKDQVLRNNVIVHIDGKHYVLVTSINDTEGTIAYIDPTVGQNGQEMTLSRAEFMEHWKGYSLAKELPQDPAKRLNVTQEKNIRGSGWWEDFWRGICNFFQKIVAPVATILLMIPPLAPVGAIVLGINIIIQTISFVVRTGTLMDVVWSVVNTIGAAIGATILPGIYEAAGQVFSSIGQAIFAPLKGVFSAVMPIFNNLSIAVSNIATGIGQIISLGTVSAKIATSIGYNVIAQGISIGSNYLFKSMNLDPSLANIGSALLTGAIMGAISPNTNIVAEAVKYGTITGVEEVGKATDLDSNITHLAGMMAGSLVGGAITINGKIMPYDVLTRSISPNIASECAYIGMTELGELLGVDPRISYLAGVGIRSTINAGLTHEFKPDEIWGSVTQGLLQGVTNIGLNFATEELGISPLLANIGFSAISGAINAGIQAATGGSKDVFGTLFKTYTDNALTFLGYGDPSNAWQQAAYISQILDFSDIVQERGLVDALNTYGAGFFNAVAVNNIVQSGYTLGGYFAEKLQAGQYTTRILNDGTEVKVVTVADGQSNAISDTFFQEKGVGESRYWDLIGGEEYIGGDSYLGWGDFGVDAYGKLGYTDAELYSMFDSDIQYQRVIGGQQAYAEIKDSLGNTLLIIEPTAGGSFNVYDSYGDYVDAKITNLISDRSYTFDDLKLNYFSELDSDGNTSLLDFDFSNPDLANLMFNNLSLSSNEAMAFNSLTLEEKRQVLHILLFNGIGNPEPTGVPPGYMKGFGAQLAIADPLAIQTTYIASYENSPGWTGIARNCGVWLKDVYLSSDVVTDDIMSEINYKFNGNPPTDMVGLAYSGDGDPLLQALNKYPTLDMKSVVLVGAPLRYGRKIMNTNVENVIMIGGDLDYICQAGGGVPFQDFEGSANQLNTYKIILKGIDHFNYTYDPNSQSPNPLAVKSAKFITRVASFSNNSTRLNDFLIRTPGVTYNSNLKMYVVDLNEVQYDE